MHDVKNVSRARECNHMAFTAHVDDFHEPRHFHSNTPVHPVSCGHAFDVIAPTEAKY